MKNVAKKKISKEELRKGILESVTAHIKDPVERQKAIERIEAEGKKEEERRAWLKTNAKPKEELIVRVECTVESIISSTYQGRFTPESEVRYGGHSPSYGTGNYLCSEIKVNTTNTPIKTLEFSGWPHIERGDRISAYIFKAKEEYNPEISVAEFLQEKLTYQKPKPIYVERDFKEKETPVKIEKLVNGFVAATYVNK